MSSHVLSRGIYCQAAPLFGYLGDRYNRKFLLVLGMVILNNLTIYLYIIYTIYTISTLDNLGLLLPDLQLHALLHTLPLRAGAAQHRYRVQSVTSVSTPHVSPQESLPSR